MNHVIKNRLRRGLDPVVGALVSLRVHPNTLTALGLAFSIVAAASIGSGRVRAGGIWLLVSGLFDIVDGAVARRAGQASRRGAALDSILDRYAEGAVFAGLAWFYAHREGSEWTLLAVVLVLMGSFLVSYVRARSEGLGLACQIGLMERPERLALLIVGLLIGPSVMPGILWGLAILAHLTALQRLAYIYRELRG
jgi:CDP-diacylglycerol--glycerol-3-phosphate 3-phosphatidyltransferase